eukprot:Partr_v1_DN27272_c2_g1_i1_m38391 putative ATP-dependent RNA helicase required for ribosome biogenesis. Involved in the release of U14 snoRNA in pre-ribosomal complexes. Required for pre-rRNA cleavage at site A2 (By similarity)
MAIKKDRKVDKRKVKADEAKELEELLAATREPVDTASMKSFADLPISKRTLQGLKLANYIDMTDIQRSSLKFSLCSRDVLGAAKTGSGKTLAFVIPILECLYRQKWTLADGLGALVISPTRELAVQIFGVLKNVGKFHSLSAALVIGGKDVEYEKERINRMNILICTPGRLLQHMDSTPNFDCGNLQMLVLDEADRILDMGFSKTVNAIVENLNDDRQTLLFSATQTKSVRDLARLSLKDPEYVAVHEQSKASTPDSLAQNYLVCDLQNKLDILFSFLKTHVTGKILVFISSCKQVRFVHETFCKMQPGIVLMCLHGKQRQEKRNFMFEKFCRAKSAAMFCTDIAARGLDFPAVDWVVQLDCPEDGATYIHRVGRTARFNSNGRGLLFLLPSEEEGMKAVFEKQKIPAEKITINPSKQSSITSQLQSFCAQDPEMKYLGEKAFICYLRSVWQNKNKAVFDVSKLPIEEYASSLGLPGAPQIKFIRKLKDEKNQSRALAKKLQEIANDSSDDSDAPDLKSVKSESESDDETAAIKHTTRADKMFAKKNQSLLWSHYEKIKNRNVEIEAGDAEEGDDEFMKIARRDHDLEDVPTMAPGFLERPLSVRDKRNVKVKNRLKKAEVAAGTQIRFDDDGTAHLAWKLETEGEFLNEKDGIIGRHQKYIQAATEVMREADADDKQLHKERLRERRRLRKLKENGQKEDGAVAVLNVVSSGDSGDDEVLESSHSKKRQRTAEDSGDSKQLSIQEQEDLALRLLEA